MAEISADDVGVVAQDGRQREAAEFILRLGNALLQAGYPINQIVELLLALSHPPALPQPQVYVTPTVIEVTIGPLTHQHRALLVTAPGDVNLGHLTQLDAIAHTVAAGKLAAPDGIARLEALYAPPPLHSALLVGFAYALTAAAFARTLGGGLREILVAALVGGVTGALSCLRAPLRAPPAHLPAARRVRRQLHGDGVGGASNTSFFGDPGHAGGPLRSPFPASR